MLQIAKGLKLEFDASFAPNTGLVLENFVSMRLGYRKVIVSFCSWFLWFRKKSAKIKSAYKQDYFHGTGDVDFDFAGPAVQASAVVGYVCHVQLNLSLFSVNQFIM